MNVPYHKNVYGLYIINLYKSLAAGINMGQSKLNSAPALYTFFVPVGNRNRLSIISF